MNRTQPRAHVVQYVRREKNWPRQWLGRCLCGKAIRCNSEAEAWAFFREQGCVR